MNVNDVRSRMFIYAQNISKQFKNSQNIAKQFMNQNGSVIVQCPLKNRRAWNIWWPARPITSKESKSLHFSTHIPPQGATLLAAAAVPSLGCWWVLAGRLFSNGSETWRKGQMHKTPRQKALAGCWAGKRQGKQQCSDMFWCYLEILTVESKQMKHRVTCQTG